MQSMDYCLGGRLDSSGIINTVKWRVNFVLCSDGCLNAAQRLYSAESDFDEIIAYSLCLF